MDWAAIAEAARSAWVVWLMILFGGVVFGELVELELCRAARYRRGEDIDVVGRARIDVEGAADEPEGVHR